MKTMKASFICFFQNHFPILRRLEKYFSNFTQFEKAYE